MESYKILFGIAVVITVLLFIFIILWQNDQFENTKDAATAATATKDASTLGWETYVTIGGGFAAIGFYTASFLQKSTLSTDKYANSGYY